MKQTTYSPEIQSYLDKIKENDTQNTTLVLELCQKLLNSKESINNHFLQGFAYYYMGLAYYLDGNTHEQTYPLVQAIKHLKFCQSWEMVARSYNMLGNVAAGRGNSTSALNFYLKGISICTSYDLYPVSAILYVNISIIFSQIERYEQSISYLKKSLENFLKSPLGSSEIHNLITCYVALGENQLKLNQLEEAMQCMRAVDHYLGQAEIGHANITIAVFKALLADAMHDITARDNQINEILTFPLQEYSLTTYFDDFYVLCEFLSRIQAYPALTHILSLLEPMVLDAHNLHAQLELLKIRLAYYKETKQVSLFTAASVQFYELSMKREEELLADAASAIDLQFVLMDLQEQQHKMELENKELLIKSESDALTGLPNRYKMNNYSEELLAHALENQVPFAVEILDIDYFKQYNDTYGHQAGDECLLSVAKILKSIQKDDIFCARYGGDEFIIIFYNQTLDEVKNISLGLKHQLEHLNIEHKGSPSFSHVTITQGIFYRIPIEINRMWDFLHIADGALYHAKSAGRNNIMIKTSKSGEGLLFS